MEAISSFGGETDSAISGLLVWKMRDGICVGLLTDKGVGFRYLTPVDARELAHRLHTLMGT